MMKNIKIIVEYDGTDFVGWQIQPNGRSVQEVIERVIHKVTREKVNVVGAGRTDSGVHARGQVANFLTHSSFAPHDFYRALNGILPPDVVIHSVEEADEHFSARYSATEREYAYYISRNPTAIGRKYSWRLNYPFDLDAMNEVCRRIIGTHDFQSFCKTESSVDHHRCTVLAAEWREENGKLLFTIRANRFLHGMVRALVGTMVDIGRGFTPPDQFDGIMQAHDRTKAGQAAPPHGLFLERVYY